MRRKVIEDRFFKLSFQNVLAFLVLLRREFDFCEFIEVFGGFSFISDFVIIFVKISSVIDRIGPFDAIIKLIFKLLNYLLLLLLSLLHNLTSMRF